MNRHERRAQAAIGRRNIAQIMKTEHVRKKRKFQQVVDSVPAEMRKGDPYLPFLVPAYIENMRGEKP